MNRIGIIAIASRCTLLGVAGALALPFAAQAACEGSWDLPKDWWLKQDNGYAIEIVISNQDGNKYSGEAAVANVDNGRFKPFSAEVNANHLAMTITAAGGIYTGTIMDDGRILGTTTNPNNGETAAWHGDRPATCIVIKTAPPPPPPPPPPEPVNPLEKAGVLEKPGTGIGEILKQTSPNPTPPAAKTATVIADVDVYKAPGGAGKSLGVLRSNNKTTKVSLVEPCQNNWCHVKGNPVPTGEGYVYSGTPPDFQSLEF
jgi:hypothetical protein